MQTARLVKAPPSITHATLAKPSQPAMYAPTVDAVEAPDINMQLENATRLGHHFGAISVFPPDAPSQSKRAVESVQRLSAFSPTGHSRVNSVSVIPAGWAVPPRVQTKLTVGEPNDPDEQEADRVADQVMRMAEPRVQAKCACGGEAGPDGECAACKAKRLAIQRQVQDEPAEREEVVQTQSDSAPSQAAPDLESRLNGSRGSGHALPADTRSSMESAFGADFGGVRVHTDGEAVQMNRELSAQAYVIQQSKGLAWGIQRAPAVSDYTKRQTNVERSGITRLEVHNLEYGSTKDFAPSDLTYEVKKDGKTVVKHSDERNKTNQSAKQMAVVLMPDALQPDQPVQVLLHFHGWGWREGDPYAGYRVGKNKGGTVRDVAQERLEQQIGAFAKAKGVQVVGILAQGVGKSDFGDIPTFEYIRDVLLKSNVPALVKVATDEKYSVVLSAHSGGGSTQVVPKLREGKAETADRSKLAYQKAGKDRRVVDKLQPVDLIVLFEALNGPNDVKYVHDWVNGQLNRLVPVLKAAASPSDAKALAELAATPKLRGYFGNRESGYAKRYKDLNDKICEAIAKRVPEAWRADVGDLFRIIAMEDPGGKRQVGHEEVISGTGPDPAAGTLGDALSASRNPAGDRAKALPCSAQKAPKPKKQALGQRGVFVSRQVHRDSAAAAMATFVTPNGLAAQLLRRLQRLPAPPPTPAPTPAHQVEAAADRVSDTVRAAAAPLIGTADGDDVVGIVTQQIIARRANPSAALRRRSPTHPALALYDVLYGTDVVADLTTIDTRAPGANANARRKAADETRRGVFAAVLGGLVTDVRASTAVAAPAAALDQAVQVAGERAMVPAVLPFISTGRTWEDVRIGVITEFGGLVAGTRTALARANDYYSRLQRPTFLNVTQATRVHPDLNAAFVRAAAVITRRLAATPEPQRAQITAAIRTSLGRNTFSAVLRENRNAPHRLSDHSFGFAIDIDSSRNPNISSRGGLAPVQDVTGDDPTAGTTANRTGVQVEATATDLREISDEYQAAMTSDATLAPVLLRLANAGRARVTPPLLALASGADLVAAVVLRQRAARAAALRAALWPEGAATRAPTPPSEVAATERRIARIGDAFRASFTDAARTRRVGASSEGTPGTVAAQGFMTLPSILVGALAGSDGGNLRWLGTANQDFMHFELMTRPALFTAGDIVDPAPPDATHAA